MLHLPRNQAFKVLGRDPHTILMGLYDDLLIHILQNYRPHVNFFVKMF